MLRWNETLYIECCSETFINAAFMFYSHLYIFPTDYVVYFSLLFRCCMCVWHMLLKCYLLAYLLNSQWQVTTRPILQISNNERQFYMWYSSKFAHKLPAMNITGILRTLLSSNQLINGDKQMDINGESTSQPWDRGRLKNRTINWWITEQVGPENSHCQYQSSDWLWRPPPKWPLLCRVGR